MNTNPTITEAARAAETTDQSLARAWLEHRRSPADDVRFAALAEGLDQKLRQSVSLTGSLHGQENELRQRALILLCSGFLSGNAELLAVTTSGDLARIASQMRRSICAAIRAVRNELARQHHRRAKRHCPLENADDLRHASRHVSDLSFESLPLAKQQELLWKAAEQAFWEGALSRSGYRVVRRILEHSEITQKEVAGQLGVTPSAVNQHLKAARKVLPRYLNDLEFGA